MGQRETGKPPPPEEEGLGGGPRWPSVNWEARLNRTLRQLKQNPTELGSPILAINSDVLSEPWHFYRCGVKPSGFCALPCLLKPTISEDKGLWAKMGDGRRGRREGLMDHTLYLHQKEPVNNL